MRGIVAGGWLLLSHALPSPCHAAVVLLQGIKDRQSARQRSNVSLQPVPPTLKGGNIYHVD